MWSIFQQNIQKRYFTPILSRGFLIAAICYLIAFLLPVLILVSIGYSWVEDSKVLLKPTIKHENYQISCLMSDLTTLYDSSFADETQASRLSSVSVGSDASMFSVSAYIQGSVLSCTILTYNRILLNSNYQILATIPFSFHHSASNSTSNLLTKVTQRGKLEVFSSNILLDTTIPFQQTSYKTTGDFSMTDNAVKMSGRNLSAFVDVAMEKKEYGSISGVEFVGSFEIEGELFIKSQSLLNKIRAFVPFYMFLWLPILFFVVVPLVQWMFANKLYYAKCDKGKVKVQ